MDLKSIGVNKKMKKTSFDTTLNIAGILVLIGMSLYLMIHWSSLPDQMPMHYDLNGEIDRWGSKAELLLIPAAAWIMYLFLSVVERFPGIWNTGIEVTTRNKEQVYTLLHHCISTLKLLVTLLIAGMAIMIQSLPSWFLPLMTLIIIMNIGYWFWRLWKI